MEISTNQKNLHLDPLLLVQVQSDLLLDSLLAELLLQDARSPKREAPVQQHETNNTVCTQLAAAFNH